jgi:hypothetical protein
LLPTSCHPAHCTDGIIVSLALRIKRCCSLPEDYIKRLGELQELLLQRKYRGRAIDAAFEKVEEIERKDALKKVVRKEKEKRVKFVIRYDPRYPKISEVIRRNHKIMLEDDARLLNIPEYRKPAMTVYTRPRNNAETIIRAKLPPEDKGMVTRASQGKEEGFKRCGQSNCNMCPHTATAPGETKTKVKISSTGEYMPIRGSLNCNSKEILYLAGHNAEKPSRP